MDFTLTEEQRELRSIVRKFLGARSPEAEVRRLMATEEGFDPDVWRQMSDQLGLPGLAIPEEYGGAGFGYVELGLVFEEMGRALLCAPYFSTVLAAEVLLRSGDEDAKKDLLPGIASGETIATLALLERASGWGPDDIALAATHGPGGWTLTGQKKHVLDGHVAGLVLVAARTPAGVSVFAVGGGYTATPVETMDQTRKQAELVFDRTAARLIGEDGAGWATLGCALDTAAIMLGAEQVGGASAALDMAVEYAKVRIQFGRPIGSFQAIKHKCADMLAETESARSAAYYGMWALAADDDDISTAARLAKVYCSQAYMHVAAENIQIHGGIGFTWEHPAHLYFKRAKTCEVLLGTPAYHRELLARQLGL
jgi:alkylation response protein AidB-like acyl-CoA dehydrogenase